jgi:hypothetical protein
MKQANSKLYIPVLSLFVALSVLFLLLTTLLNRYGFNNMVLLIGNTILFLVTVISLHFHMKGFLHKNVQVFFRSVYGALMIKMFVCAGAVIIYAMMAKKNVNKPALFSCMALYFVYTFIEVKMVFRLLKQKKNDEQKRS